MDKFVTVSKPSSLRARIRNDEKDQKRTNRKYTPYPKVSPGVLERASIPSDTKKLSSSTLTRYLLRTLSDESNPITHSDSGEYSDNIISISTGHQVSERRRNERQYSGDRSRKLTNQREDQKTAGVEVCNVLKNVRIYINGFLNNTTDIEMKRIVCLAGGTILNSASGATHILTSQQLSSAKTHKILTTNLRNLVHIVKPEWVTDSIKAGKRRLEREYSILKPASTKNLREMLNE